MTTFGSIVLDRLPDPIRQFLVRRISELAGLILTVLVLFIALSMASWSARDPSLNFASNARVENWVGTPGAIVSDLLMQTIGLAGIGLVIPLFFWGLHLLSKLPLQDLHLRTGCWIAGVAALSAFLSLLPVTDRWPLPTGMGGMLGDALLVIPRLLAGNSTIATTATGLVFALVAILLLKYAASQPRRFPPNDKLAADENSLNTDRRRRIPEEPADAPLIDPDGEPTNTIIILGAIAHLSIACYTSFIRVFRIAFRKVAGDVDRRQVEPDLTASRTEQHHPEIPNHTDDDRHPPYGANVVPRLETMPSDSTEQDNQQAGSIQERERATETRVVKAVQALKPGKRVYREAQASMWTSGTFELPPIALLSQPRVQTSSMLSEDALEQNARLLEGVLEDFGVRGEIINVRPGPVVTLYELEPAPGIKSSRVIGLAEDIARSMSAISARVAVVSGRNAIGIELPNQKRDTVYLRELLASDSFERTKAALAICLGKTIGGESVITDLARMPHLLVAGTTGSGKSVAINTMILSLLYRLTPDQCKLIMIDPKMLELSVYDGIPHLLTPVVTDPKKAVVALKWAVREMEDRYQKMSKLGVRNIEGFNKRVAEAKSKGKTISRTIQTGFDRNTGEAIYEEEEFDLNSLPFIVVIVDEMADLMMVAGKDIEGAIQRLAQMARAAGIHLIMATQRPSVDVITGTIKANFPTRISFQVTSKIDSRTILGEQGAEQLLGQGDMLYMAGGGRISRVHGPFVADDEVEEIVSHLKRQGQPEYLDAITIDDDEASQEDDGSFAPGGMDAEESMSLYDRAVAIVLRDQKCSTSYIQRRLSVGYNKAASLVEQMEDEGVVSAANHAGKREILVGDGVDRNAIDYTA